MQRHIARHCGFTDKQSAVNLIPVTVHVQYEVGQCLHPGGLKLECRLVLKMQVAINSKKIS